MLTNIGVRNYRSFDLEGVFLPKLSKINILVGKNNSGKSNLIRFLRHLAANANDIHKLSTPSYVDSYVVGDAMAVSFSFSHADLNFPQVLNNTLIPRINLKDVLPDPFEVWLPFAKERYRADMLPEELRQLDVKRLMAFTDGSGTFVKEKILNDIAERIDNEFSARIKILKDLIYIPDLRIINPSDSHNYGNSKINGKNIIKELHQMQHPNPGDDYQRENFDKLERLVKSLLNSNDLVLEISHDKQSILIKMHGKRLPLDSYGSGVYQIILLCGALLANEDKIVCIEEPETHLHPELQRKFFDFILKETDNTYFITSHSNTFLNYSENVSIYHIEHDQNKSSITKIENSKSAYKLLDDMGYKASDLIQANGIIWVEGPSDRNYLLKWISLLDEGLKEGLHFSIMFYGGRNLANVTFASFLTEDLEGTTNNIIPLLKINRNAIVVIDSDRLNGKDEINATKERIQEEIGADKCWITSEKEIENYISAEAVRKWLTKLKVYNGKKIDISLPLFGDIVKSGDTSARINYNARKNMYSNQISEEFSVEDLETNGLRTEMEKIIKSIKSWNQAN
ncbi:ATP-dependent nuclease [Mucilaginibacter sp. P25]|uniref:ATP-dependent nuclease n=1 Tax=Mucilaginibacter sp. P25 TaxID=3423945 RepID=UPI003D78D5DA